MKKIGNIIFLYFFVFIMCMGASFAWYAWKGSEVSVDVNFANLDPYIKYSSLTIKDSDKNKTLTESDSYTGGIGYNLVFNKNANGDNLDAYGQNYLKVTSTTDSDIFKASNLKWTLVSVSGSTRKEISTGNFVGENIVEGNDTSKMIPISIDFSLTKESDNTSYEFYLWLDSNGYQNIDISGKNIDVSIASEASTIKDKDEMYIRSIEYETGVINKFVAYSSMYDISGYKIINTETTPNYSDSDWITISSNEDATIESGKIVTIEPNYDMKEVNNICIKNTNGEVYCKSIGKYNDEAEDKPTSSLCKSNLTYNGELQQLVSSTSGVGYTLSEKDYNQTNANLPNEKGYKITAKLNDGYVWKDGTSDNVFFYCKIAQKDLNVKALDQTIDYGSKVDNSKITVSGLITGHSVSSVTLTQSTSNVTTTTNGVITPSDAKIVSGSTDVTSNYNISYKTGKLVINALSIEDSTIALDPTCCTYDGNKKEPTVSVVLNNKTLVLNTDYRVSYSNNENAGTATVTVTGKGNYTGSKSINFAIGEATPTITVDPTSLSLTMGTSKTFTYTYNGDGKVSCVSSNTSYATCSINTSTKTVTVTPVSTTSSAITIGLYAEKGTNYEELGSSTSPNKTVSVTITGKKYTITYNKGAGVSAIGKTSDSCTTSGTSSSCTVVAPTITPNTGYGTGKWGTSNTIQGSIVAGSNITLSGNATYYAISLINTYTMTVTKNTGVNTIYYKVNGASSWTSTTSSTSVSGVKYGTAVTYYYTVNTGYTADKSCTSSSPCTLSSSVTGNLTLSPTATVNNYTISFNSNGGTGTMSDLAMTYGTAKTLTANSFKKQYTVTYNYDGATGGNSQSSATANYKFVGWTKDGINLYSKLNLSNNSFTIDADGMYYVSKSNTNTSNSYLNFFYNMRDDIVSGNDYTEVDVIKTLEYSGSYNFHVGDTHDTTKTQITYGVKDISDMKVGNNYFALKGSTNSSPSLLSRGFITLPANASITIKFRPVLIAAKYNNIDMYFFDSSSVKNLTATNGDKVNLYADWNETSITLPTPTKTGYKFAGWYTASSGGTKVGNGGESYTPTSNVTLYARWNANTYTLSFNANSGNVATTSKIVTYGSTYGDLPTPIRSGYTFIGWFKGDSAASKDSSKLYKDYPLYYYADTYYDLDNTFGYNQDSLYNHYLNYGKTEGRRLSQFLSTDTVNITSNTTLYAGWYCTDTTAPTISINNPKNGVWTNQDISVVISFSDSGSGIDASSLSWSTDNQNWSIISNTSTSSYTDTWSAERNSTGYYRICDNAGNCNTASTSIKIDKTAPTLTIDNPTNGKVSNSDITVKLSFSDNASGINASSLQWKNNTDKTSWTSISNTSTSSCEDTWSEEGERTGYYKICDNAGNCTEASTPIKIKKTFNVSFNANGGNVSTSSKKVTYGSTYGDLPTPTNNGYTFIGWFDANSYNAHTIKEYESQMFYYKDYPLYYYADTYSDLYNAFGYNQKSLYSHYLSNGKAENRRLSQYMSTDTVNITSDTTLYAGWYSNEYTLTITSGTGGSVLVENTTKSTSVTIASGSTGSLGAGTGDIIKVTATKADYYSLSSIKHGSTSMSSGGTFTVSSDETIAATWSVNKVHFKFNANGGTVTASTTASDGTVYAWTQDSSGVISKDGTVEFYASKSATAAVDLPNYNNSKYLNITKSGYGALAEANYKCLSNNCNSTTYHQFSGYKGSDFCDTKASSCTVELGVNWVEATYQIYNSSNSNRGFTNNLTQAVNKVTTGGTIKALKNNSSAAVTISKNVTLNTNGKTITMTNTITNPSGYTLSISGSGKITTSSSIDNLILVNGTTELATATLECSVCTRVIGNNGTFNMSSGNVVNNSQNAINVYHGSINITGGNIESKGTTGIRLSGGIVNIITSASEVSISGLYYGIFAINEKLENSTININGSDAKLVKIFTTSTDNGSSTALYAMEHDDTNTYITNTNIEGAIFYSYGYGISNGENNTMTLSKNVLVESRNQTCLNKGTMYLGVNPTSATLDSAYSTAAVIIANANNTYAIYNYSGATLYMGAGTYIYDTRDTSSITNDSTKKPIANYGTFNLNGGRIYYNYGVNSAFYNIGGTINQGASGSWDTQNGSYTYQFLYYNAGSSYSLNKYSYRKK